MKKQLLILSSLLVMASMLVFCGNSSTAEGGEMEAMNEPLQEVQVDAEAETKRKIEREAERKKAQESGAFEMVYNIIGNYQTGTELFYQLPWNARKEEVYRIDDDWKKLDEERFVILYEFYRDSIPIEVEFNFYFGGELNAVYIDVFLENEQQVNKYFYQFQRFFELHYGQYKFESEWYNWLVSIPGKANFEIGLTKIVLEDDWGIQLQLEKQL